MWKFSSQILHMINLIKETVVREEVCATLYSNTWVHTCISWFFRQHSSWILAVYVTDYSSTSVITYYRTTWRCIRQYDSTVFRQKRRGSPQMMRPTHWGELVSGPKRIQYGNKTFISTQVTYVIYTLWGKTFFCRFILMTGINQWERMRTEVKTVWVERGTEPRLLQPKPHLGMPRSRMSFGKVRTWDVRSLFFLVALIMLLVQCSSRQNKTSYSPSPLPWIQIKKNPFKNNITA